MGEVGAEMVESMHSTGNLTPYSAVFVLTRVGNPAGGRTRADTACVRRQFANFFPANNGEHRRSSRRTGKQFASSRQTHREFARNALDRPRVRTAVLTRGCTYFLHETQQNQYQVNLFIKSWLESEKISHLWRKTEVHVSLGTSISFCTSFVSLLSMFMLHTTVPFTRPISM